MARWLVHEAPAVAVLHRPKTPANYVILGAEHFFYIYLYIQRVPSIFFQSSLVKQYKDFVFFLFTSA